MQRAARWPHLRLANTGSWRHRRSAPSGSHRRGSHVRTARGHLIRVHRGVYAVGHARLTVHGRWTAAVLACGPGALLSHHTAAALHELRTAPTGPIDVTAPGVRRHPGIRTHTARHPEPGTTIDGVPVTSLERALLDYATVVTPRRLSDAVDAAQRSGRLRPERISATIDAAGGHPGTHALRRQLEQRADETPWTQSELERRFLGLVRDAGLPPPRANVLVDGLLVDFYWPEAELVVEVDGFAFHRGHASFERDRANDTVRALHGRTTIRPTYRRIEHDRTGLQRDLSRLLAAGRRER